MAGTDIGKAYVQIVPSARGIKGSISNVLDPEASEAGTKSGNSIVGSLGKTLMNAAIWAGIGKFIGDAIGAGADLEQSFGGLDTIYGDAAEAAKQFAYEASQMGISANDYAEQAVSMGAALKQAFGEGGETKAIESANMAISDMADNAAKMGTDITSLQNAYQGFAKGNYTMLDNLKLGYGGTKTEMERLLADAEKITGIHYDINNLGDVYSAIHEIQGSLDLTGVAAYEASQTFSGSMNAMKAAGQNLLADIALGNDISASLSGLLDSIQAFAFNNLFPMIGNIVSTLPTLVSQFIGEGLPMFVEQGMVMLQSMVEGFATSVPMIVDQVVVMVGQLVEMVQAHLPEIITAGINILVALLTGLIDAVPRLVGYIPTMISSVFSAIVQNLPTILQAGVQLLMKLLEGIVKTVPQLIASIPTIIKQMWEAFTNVDWGSVGKNIVEGIKNGLVNAGSSLIDSAVNLAKNAFAKVKGFLGIKSPSKKFAYLGEMSAEGFAKGFEDEMPTTADLLQQSFDGVTASLDTSIEGSGSGHGAVSISVNFQVDNSGKDITEADIAKWGDLIANTVNRKLGWQL